MTLKEFAEGLGVSRNVAARLALKIPGAKREPGRPGQIPMWVLPEDALDYMDEPMVKAAKEQATSEEERPASPVSPAAPAALPDPALVDEELAVRREKLAAEKVRAETLRLQAEAERRKVEHELNALSTSPAALAPPNRSRRSLRVIGRPADHSTGRGRRLPDIAAYLVSHLAGRPLRAHLGPELREKP